jgi:tetratricopeptide (TPR) repeat protein
MRELALVWLAPLLGLGLLGSVPDSDALGLVRQGNAAFSWADYAAAVEFYTRAEEGSTDPGLVAFNKATALYRLRHYREAELHYRRCWEDAEGTRLAHLLYSLGNAIVQQAGNSDAARLKQAIGLYELCLHQEGAEPSLLADARHNLELARLLLVKAAAGKGKNEQDDSGRTDADTQPKGTSDEGADMSDQSGSGRPDPRGKPGVLSGNYGPGAVPWNDTPFAPGKGNLPPIPDADSLTTMSPEDAAEQLKQAADRIARERKTHQQHIAPAPAANLKDW